MSSQLSCPGSYSSVCHTLSKLMLSCISPMPGNGCSLNRTQSLLTDEAKQLVVTRMRRDLQAF